LYQMILSQGALVSSEAGYFWLWSSTKRRPQGKRSGAFLYGYGIELPAVLTRLDEPDTLALVLEAESFPAALRALFTRHEFLFVGYSE
jgi:hypothetical protein